MNGEPCDLCPAEATHSEHGMNLCDDCPRLTPEYAPADPAEVPSGLFGLDGARAYGLDDE